MSGFANNNLGALGGHGDDRYGSPQKKIAADKHRSADAYKNGFNSDMHAFFPGGGPQPIVEEAQEEHEESSNSKLELKQELSNDSEVKQVDPAHVGEGADKCLIF